MPLATVKQSARLISITARHVSISEEGIKKAVDAVSTEQLKRLASPAAFDTELHFCDHGPLTAQYLLVVDALNFCFWPEPGLNYEHLAGGVKAAVQSNSETISADCLSRMSEAGVQHLFQWPCPVPLQAKRAALLREGQAANLIQQAEGSANRLVELVLENFPGFRDTSCYRGERVAFYKRAQIFVGDLWGAFQGKGLGRFDDIAELTMFADYRVPAVLREMDILQYSPGLAEQVDMTTVLQAGSDEELEIRGCTIEAVERIKQQMERSHGNQGLQLPHTIQLDWWLWEVGEEAQHRHRPHHRTITHFY